MLKKLVLVTAVVGAFSLFAKTPDFSEVHTVRKQSDTKIQRFVEEYSESKNPHKQSFKHILLNLGVPASQIESQGLIKSCASALMSAVRVAGARGLGIRSSGVVQSPEPLDGFTSNLLQEAFHNKINNKNDFDRLLNVMTYRFMSRNDFFSLRKVEPVTDGNYLSSIRLPRAIYGSVGDAEEIYLFSDSIVNLVHKELSTFNLTLSKSYLLLKSINKQNDEEVLNITVFGSCGAFERIEVSARSNQEISASIIRTMMSVDEKCKVQVARLNGHFEEQESAPLEIPPFQYNWNVKYE